MKELSDLTTHCIRCGFCLESCPTFTETGEETEGPRGRIYLVRSAIEGRLAWDDVAPHMDRCLGCRACETACPSGVEYGAIFELARDRIEVERLHPTKKALLEVATSPGLMRLQTWLMRLMPGRRLPALLSQLLAGVPPEADRPRPGPAGDWPVLDPDTLPPVRGEVYLLEGCVMRVLYPRVHVATRRLLRRVGYTVRETSAGCCGALHAHNGELARARGLAQGLVNSMSDPLPVVVNSAGCGSTMREYGHLEANWQDFADRVVDVSEFLLAHGLAEHLAATPATPLRVTYHDACHLAHGQGVRSAPRELLLACPGLELAPLPEADTCCGSAGIYNLTQPAMARRLLERKWRNIESVAPAVVVLGNPGCHAWIEQGARERGGHIRVRHTAELLEERLSGRPA